MRLLSPALLLAALLPSHAFASATIPPVAVDLAMRTVETSRFKIQFDFTHQDEVRSLIFKDWSATQSVAAYDGTSYEFWGESLRGIDSTGFLQPLGQIASTMTVVSQSDNDALLAIDQVCLGQPPTSTLYHFFADQPYFTVTRTTEFMAFPESSSYQSYLARVPFVASYRAIRYRDTAATLQQRVYPFFGILTDGWDGRWLQQVGIDGTTGFSVAQLYDSSTVHTHQFVRGYGPGSFTGWAAALEPPAWHTGIETQSFMMAFSTDVANVAAIDSLWAQYNQPLGVLSAPPPALTTRITLAAAPNPARGSVRIDWTLPLEGHAELAIFDITGRKLAVLQNGLAPAGEHATTWNGRDASGRAMPPGMYLARLATPGATRTISLVRTR